jgi:hypothetical protein
MRIRMRMRIGDRRSNSIPDGVIFAKIRSVLTSCTIQKQMSMEMTFFLVCLSVCLYYTITLHGSS